MISLTDLSLYQGGKALIREASFQLSAGSRVAVVGRNGCGKSTFFSLLLGQRQADEGDLSLPQGLRLAHMAQDTPALARSALDYVLDGDQLLRQAEAELAAAEASGDGERIARAHALIEDADGYQAPSRAARLLKGLGFASADGQKPVNEFSGGWRIRLNLAQALMTPSDLLLLDEPTNHLDLDAVLWLQDWLRQYSGTLLLISHDRDFMDALATHVLHFENRELSVYTGNYSRFEEQRASRLAQQAAAHARQQQRISEIQDFVRRFGAKATKARQAQSRLKELERMEKIAPAHSDSPFNFRIPCSEKLSNPLLSLRKGELGYQQGSPVLSSVNLTLFPGSRVGLLGANGQGKSTLIKTLVGKLPPLAGERSGGEHLHVGYFSQHQLEDLDSKATPYELMRRQDPEAREQSLRDFLGRFDFGGEAADKCLANCSGGERARLALALIAWQKPNLLLLDEPTNHLDLEMRHALNVALQGYPGALVLVTHDRHLMRALADDLILVDQGKAEPYERSLSDYEQERRRNWREDEPSNDDSSVDSPKVDRKQQKRDAAAKRQRLSPLRKAVAQAEKQLESLSEAMQSLEERLADTALYQPDQKAQLQQALAEKGELQAALDDAEARWMAASEELEQLEAD